MLEGQCKLAAGLMCSNNHRSYCFCSSRQQDGVANADESVLAGSTIQGFFSPVVLQVRWPALGPRQLRCAASSLLSHLMLHIISQLPSTERGAGHARVSAPVRVHGPVQEARGHRQLPAAAGASICRSLVLLCCSCRSMQPYCADSAQR